MVAQTKIFLPAGPSIQTSNSSISKHVGLKGKNCEGGKLAISPEGVNMQHLSGDTNRTSTFNKRRSVVIERLHTARVSRLLSPSTLKNLRMVKVVNSPHGGRKTRSLSKQVEKEGADETDVNFWARCIPCVPNTKKCFIDSTQKKGLSSRQIEKDKANRNNGSAKFWTKFVPCGTNSKNCSTDTPTNSFSDDSLNAISECVDGNDQGKSEETNEKNKTNEMKVTKGGRKRYQGSNELSAIVILCLNEISVCGK